MVQPKEEVGRHLRGRTGAIPVPSLEMAAGGRESERAIVVWFVFVCVS